MKNPFFIYDIFVSFRTAKLINIVSKKKYVNCKSYGYYVVKDFTQKVDVEREDSLIRDFKVGEVHQYNRYLRMNEDCLIPRHTLTVIQTWLRTECKIHLWIYPIGFESLNKTTIKWTNNFDGLRHKYYSTYEIALEHGVRKALKRV